MQQDRLTPIDRDGLADLYPSMRDDFPPLELKPLRRMRQLLKQGRYEPFFAELDGIRRGYAFLLKTEDSPYILLDYLAMFRPERNGGYGSRTLELLKEHCPDGLMAEVEDPDDADTPEERALRLRRVAFYQRSGFTPCPFPNVIFGVRYLIHVWTPDGSATPRKAAQCLRNHYLGHTSLASPLIAPHVRIELPDEEF